MPGVGQVIREVTSAVKCYVKMVEKTRLLFRPYYSVSTMPSFSILINILASFAFLVFLRINHI